MEYFFDKSLKSFSNKDKSIKVFLSSGHLVVTDNDKKSIRMPISINKTIKEGKNLYWKYELDTKSDQVILKILFDKVVHTEIIMDNYSITITFFNIDNVVNYQCKWYHVKGTPFKTETQYYN